MNVFELIKEKLEDMKTKSSHMEILAGIYYENTLEDAISIVDEVAQKYNNGWIPCSERLPEEYGEYLCCNKYGEYILGYPIAKTSDDGFYVENHSDGLDFATHWQPLPTLPAPYKEGGMDNV